MKVFYVTIELQLLLLYVCIVFCHKKNMNTETKHQSLLKPEDNKFHKGNWSDGKHYWLTPVDLFDQLNKEFNFDFDPCPLSKTRRF